MTPLKQSSPPQSFAATLFSFVAGMRSYLTGILMTLLIGSLQIYKIVVSPLLGSRCRFHPSCSSYAHQSIERFGPVHGSYLALRRLARCGPWHPGGLDDVPEQPDVHATLPNAVNRNSA